MKKFEIIKINKYTRIGRRDDTGIMTKIFGLWKTCNEVYEIEYSGSNHLKEKKL